MKTFFTSILFLTLSLVIYANDKSLAELSKGISCVTPPPPTIITNSANLSVCPNTSVFLQATGTGTISWYMVPTGGTALVTGNSANIGVGTSNIIFYAEANDDGCISLTRTAVTVTIINQPAAPSNVTPLTNLSTCALTSATLTASSSSPISWYTTASTVTPISTGSVYVTPSTYAIGTYTFYAAAQNSCGFSVRTPITYTVNGLPNIFDNTPAASGNICANSSANISVASSASNISWYSSPTAGTLLGTGSIYVTPSLTNTTSFYPIATTAQGCTRTATVTVSVYKSPIDISNAGSQSICFGQSTIISANTSPGSIRWYNAATGGTLLASALSLNTGTLATTTTFYAENNNAYCIPPRTPFTVTVTPIPTAPLNITPAGNQSVCYPNTTTTLSASGVGTLNWYASATGGISLATGTTFTNPGIISNTTYYVGDNVGNCISPTRTPITVTVNIVSTPAFSGPASISICSGSTASLTATSPGPISWFASPTGTTALTTGTVYTTPTLTSNTSYYISTISNGCESARAVKTVTVNPLPSQPVNLSSTIGLQNNVCSGNIAEFYVGTNCNWYTSATGGTSFLNSNSYSTPTLTTTTTYYVDRTVNGCTSAPRVALVATVNPMPSVISQTVQNLTCNGSGNGSISLTLNNPSSFTYNWTPNVSTTYSATSLAAGIYTVQISSGAGLCVTTQTYNVNQPAAYNVPVNIIGGNILNFNDSYTGGTTFQWLDCNNGNAPISGAVNVQYTPTVSGSYALVVTDVCASTSTCTSILITGINENAVLNSITLQPNPASTFFTLNNVADGTTVNVMDVTGKVVASTSSATVGNNADKTMTIETDNLSNGIYIIQLKNNGAVAHKKLVISK
jgi:hypothetical protein